jgi:lysophospholipid acyltransferase (LPLAT)-like uncharacterized protein
MADPIATPTVKPRKRVSGVVIPNQPTRSQRLLAWLIATGLRGLTATLRYHYPTSLKIPAAPVIFALWHNRLALCMHAYVELARPQRERDCLAALISASKDGALLSAVLKNFRVTAVRGSSSRRGGQALIELVSMAKQGYDLAVTPDGPRGPCYVAQEGVLVLAQLTGAPIIPVSCRLGWKIRAKSWDRFQIPLPFSRCEISVAPPMYVPRETSPGDREKLRQQLEEILRAGTKGD